MHKPASTPATHNDSEGPEGSRADATEGTPFVAALTQAVNYRGDVTLRLRGGEVVCGYVYDFAPNRGGGDVVRVIPAEGQRRTIPSGEIESIEFSGRDTASGRSFESWMKKYVQKRLAGERAAIDGEPASG